MIDYTDYTQDPKDVARAEQRPLTGQELKDEAEEYYAQNTDLLAAHVRAARVLQRNGLPISARNLTEFVRWFSKYLHVIDELKGCYEGVIVKHGKDFKIANATSPWLTRYLEKRGFEVTKSKSKMDACHD